MEKLTVVKIGGKVIDVPEQLESVLADFAKIEGHKILVHGGGAMASKFMKSNLCKILRSAAISHTSTTLCALSLTLIYVLQQQLNTEIHIYLQLQQSIAKRRLSWVPLYYKYWG